VKSRLIPSIIDFDPQLWAALAGATSPMMEWGWLSALEIGGVTQSGGSWQPHTLELVDSDDEVAMVCPLYLREESDGEYFWYEPLERAELLRGRVPGPRAVIAVPWTPVPGRRILTGSTGGEEREALLAEAAGACLRLASERGWRSVHLLFCTAEEEAAFARAGFFGRRSYQFQWENPKPQSGGSFDEYLRGLSSSRRNSVRRERRTLAELGIEVRHESGSASTFTNFWEDYRATARRNDCEEPPLPESFMSALESQFAHRVEFAVARKGREVLGRSLNLLGLDGCYYGRYWGAADPPQFLHFEVALYAGIERCLELGLARFDPGFGGEHKLSRGFAPQPVYSAHWYADPGLQTQGAFFAQREAQWLENNVGW